MIIERNVVVTEYNKGTSNEYKMPKPRRLMNQIDYLFENKVYKGRFLHNRGGH